MLGLGQKDNVAAHAAGVVRDAHQVALCELADGEIGKLVESHREGVHASLVLGVVACDKVDVGLEGGEACGNVLLWSRKGGK